jgi:hypothetical protein
MPSKPRSAANHARLDGINQWFIATVTKLSKKSELAGAIHALDPEA